MEAVRFVIIALLAGVISSACSIKRMAIGSLADTLSATGDVFASDEDPEFVRDAVPFALKTMESLLVEVPRHRPLLLAACEGFTQYAYAFIQVDAEILESDDYEAAVELRARARQMYLRARDYCLRSLEVEHPGLRARLVAAPGDTLKEMEEAEIDVLYWTGASWGGAIALGLDQPALVADLPVVRALMDWVLEIDEGFGDGAIHEVLVVLESVPEAMGGSTERARRHFERAIELSRGRSAGPYVSLATSVSVKNQDRDEFTRLLEQALAIDPNETPRLRLANLIAQKRARHLLATVDELFADE